MVDWRVAHWAEQKARHSAGLKAGLRVASMEHHWVDSMAGQMVEQMALHSAG